MRSMSRIALASGAVLAGFSSLPARPALACGDELPVSCADPEDAARNLLGRAVVAVKHDKARALTWFSEQSHDFRTVDLYVFCIGPNHVIDAHPDPKLRGTDAMRLVDVDGFRFAEAMIEKASADSVSRITYKWPKLGQTKPIVKHTFYTRANDEVCGVGSYDD